MPFTFSHPAIVLPLTFLPRNWYSLTGLIIGSLTPDFEYFIRMRIQSDYSHTIPGLFWFDLPLGILLTFIFHNLVRNRLFDNLPVSFQSRISSYKSFNWNGYFKNNWVIVSFSVLIGAGSHLLWDSFTHHDGYFAEKIAVLHRSVTMFGKPVTVLKMLQHSSTVAGAAVIAYALFKLPEDHSKPTAVDPSYWLMLVSITLIIAACKIAFPWLNGAGAENSFPAFGNILVTFISAILISLAITPLLIKKHLPDSSTF